MLVAVVVVAADTESAEAEDYRSAVAAVEVLEHAVVDKWIDRVRK